MLIGEKSPIIKPAKNLAEKQEVAGLFTTLKNGPIGEGGLALSLNFEHKIDLIPSQIETPDPYLLKAKLPKSS